MAPALHPFPAPRPLLLLLKTNDCLRAVDYALGHPVNTFAITARECSAALARERLRGAPGPLARAAVALERLQVGREGLAGRAESSSVLQGTGRYHEYFCSCLALWCQYVSCVYRLCWVRVLHSVWNVCCKTNGHPMRTGVEDGLLCTGWGLPITASLARAFSLTACHFLAGGSADDGSGFHGVAGQGQALTGVDGRAAEAACAAAPLAIRGRRTSLRDTQ